VAYQRYLKPIQTRDGCLIKTGSGSFIDFSSNDSLGLATNSQLLNLFNDMSFDQFGSTGSRLLTGDSCYMQEFELNLANWLNKDRVLIFNSGFQLNSGILSTLLTKNDAIFMDKQCHASLINGALASPATFYRYRHHDLKHLALLLDRYRQQYQRVVIVTESMFSMDGTQSDLTQLIKLKKSFNAFFYVDDAHSIGLYGDEGKGLCEQYLPEIDYFVATFGKAFGSFGAFFACDNWIYDKIINQCRSFIYSTALPRPVIYWNGLALDWIKENQLERDNVLELASYFRMSLNSLGISFTGEGHIISILTEDEKGTIAFSSLLQSNGFYVLPILPPTVPSSACCIRFSITRAHTVTMIDDVIACTRRFINT